MNWTPWKPETRAEPMNYTDQIIAGILTRASGTVADAGALAATEAAVGLYSRCVGSATVSPSNALTASVTPEVLTLAGRALASRGNAVFVIVIEGGAVRLAPVASWTVEGEADPSTHVYRCDMAGPSRQSSVRVEAAGVVHFRINCEIARPWAGRSPLQVAVASGRLAAAVEKSLELEELFRPSRVVHTARSGDQVHDYAVDLKKGGLLVENIYETDSGTASKTPHTIGPNPGENQIDLRTDASRSILSCYGLSPALFEASGDGSGQREAFRRMWASVFVPIVRGMAAELAVKLDTPGLGLELAELRASDSQGQGRALSARAVAVKQLVEAGVDRARALELAGFGDA